MLLLDKIKNSFRYRLNNVSPFLQERFQDLLYPKICSRYKSHYLISKYNGHLGQIRSNQDTLGLGLIHYSFLLMQKPKKILCIGSMRGFIPAICATACRDTNFGHVYFVDAGFDSSKNPKGWGNDDFWQNVTLKKHFKDLYPQWLSFYLMTSLQFSKQYPKLKFDYIYIDGDHTYTGVKTDYQLFWPKLKKNGFMLFHDILGKGDKYGLKFGVTQFWDELPRGHKISINFPKESGLGILQKK